MPSQALAEISAQIERQETDSFGKFYLYASLLQELTVRKKGRNFTDVPQYTPNSGTGIGRAVGSFMTAGHIEALALKTGPVSGELTRQVGEYKASFDVDTPNFFMVIQRILLSFARKGQLSDLIFIIKKMNDHLAARPMAIEQYNGILFNDISFNNRQPNVRRLLATAEQVTNLAQKSVDHAMYGYLLVIAAGLATKITFALGGVALTLVMLAASGYAAFYLFQSALRAFEEIETSAEKCLNIVNTMVIDQANMLAQPNNLSFIIKSIVAPVAYMGTTVREQLALSRAQYRQSQEGRRALDNLYQNDDSLIENITKALTI